MIGTKLAVVEEHCDASGEEEEEESEDEIEDGPSATKWEEMHDVIFTKPILFSHGGLNSSVESLMEDEENCALNLSNMYNDENLEQHSVQIKIEVDEDKSVEKEKQIADDDNTVDVIDDLLKSFEKEVEMNLEAVPIVNVENE